MCLVLAHICFGARVERLSAEATKLQFSMLVREIVVSLLP